MKNGPYEKFAFILAFHDQVIGSISPKSKY